MDKRNDKKITTTNQEIKECSYRKDIIQARKDSHCPFLSCLSQLRKTYCEIHHTILNVLKSKVNLSEVQWKLYKLHDGGPLHLCNIIHYVLHSVKKIEYNVSK